MILQWSVSDPNLPFKQKYISVVSRFNSIYHFRILCLLDLSCSLSNLSFTKINQLILWSEFGI
ncbi:hypothetical protein HanIR_Chr03g0101381 [Helianthus annuus]|nr:hypothetical protein HanIR_Chr03g0101381 [Helianthus annuus]